MNTNDSDKTKFYMLAGKKIARPAFITLLSGIILALVIAIFIPYGVFIAIYVLLIFLLLSYNINCTLVGHCKTWAWILTVIYLIYVTISVIVIFTNKDAWIAMFMRPKTGSNISKSLKTKTK